MNLETSFMEMPTLMIRLLALAVIAALTSCSSGPSLDDRSSVAAVVIGTLYTQVHQGTAVAAVCRSGRKDVAQAVLTKIKTQSVPLVPCSSVDPATLAKRLRTLGGARPAVILSVDKMTFKSPEAATVVGHCSYGGLNAEGFAFDVRKDGDGWYVAKQASLWMS